MLLPPHPSPATSLASPVAPAVDITRRFVRVTAERGAFVEFDFAIGWPELSVELVLPRAAFEEFCARNAVTFLEPKPDEPTPQDDEET
ncbi:Phenol hydroxylase subunit [Tepidimonas aquatica]|uniref:Phenol hydroxylase subunit n=1 Tax=Tepidimonas aquatica TaxID=247482 RepID=A0A554W9Y8_9BURK|nr:Phenol hydroxylase subunit [Tepidimonas aquatica]